MDLLSSIRKSGSRGGVDFKWEDVSSSQHRENYLGHSLMAPVGRWQKGKDLSWYAKADTPTVGNETAEEKRVRERKEEIRKIKEAEEDALAKALGLPVPNRNGPGAQGTGSNNVEVGELKRIMKETEAGNDESEEIGKGRGFGDFVGKIEGFERVEPKEEEKGGLLRRDSDRRDSTKNDNARRDRRRSRSREGRHRRDRDRVEKHRHGSRSGGIGHKGRRRHEAESETSRSRSRSPERNSERRRYRERSPDRERSRRDDRDPRRDSDRRPRRSRSPDVRERDQDRGRNYGREGWRESGPERRR